MVIRRGRNVGPQLLNQLRRTLIMEIFKFELIPDYLSHRGCSPALSAVDEVETINRTAGRCI